VATRKHNLIAVVGTLSAALTLSACGGVGYDSSYGSDQQPAAANVENAAPEPPAGGLEPAAGAEGQEPAAGGEEREPATA